MSDLAYRLWEARDHPLGAPEVDWFLAEKLVNEYRKESPFDNFLRRATKALQSSPIAPGQRDDVEYARVMEERRYVIDVLDRVEMLALTYSRLRALSGLYRHAEAQIAMTKCIIREEPLTWEAPKEIEWQIDYLVLEARVLTAFVYFELTSLEKMLKGLNVPVSEGELQYLVKARDKFLAHPMFGSRVRNAHGALSITQDGLLHPHAIYANETDSVLFNHYSISFALRDSAGEARLRDDNEKLIRSTMKNRNFTADEKLRLKAFGIREPDLDASLKEMANLLLTSALPEVERIGAQPIPSRRRFPWTGTLPAER